MNKRLNNLIKVSSSIVLSLIFVFSSSITYQLSYANEIHIPDKGTFFDYVGEMYNVDKGAANYDEVTETSIKDYKNRYIMYVDIDYVLGDINEAPKPYIYYLEDYGEYYFPPEYSPTPSTLLESVPAITETDDITFIWNYLKGQGFTDIACSAIMGNMKAESAFIPSNLQNSCEKKSGFTDASYTKAVDNGEYTKTQFVKDSYGYGLVQFTYHTWKEMLYDNAKARKVSISDKLVQLDTLMVQIAGLKNSLNAYQDIKDATVFFQEKYEKPKVITEQTKETRARYAQEVYNAYAKGITGNGGETIYFQGTIPEGFSKSLYCGDAKFGKKTLKESGAGPTAIAMVATALSTYITPDEVAKHSVKYANPNGGSKIEILTDVSDYGLKVTRIGKDINKLDEALKAGKIAIAVTGNKEAGGVTGLFNRTSDGNFIVIFGYNDDGYLDVADPDGSNYYNIKNKDITLEYLKGESIGGFYVYEPLEKN